MLLPILSPISFKSVEFRDEMGLRMSNGICPCFLAFFVHVYKFMCSWI